MGLVIRLGFLLALVLAPLLPPAVTAEPEIPPEPPADASTPANEAATGVCEGDEQILFAPPEPHAGQTMLVAVTSRRDHIGV